MHERQKPAACDSPGKSHASQLGPGAARQGGSPAGSGSGERRLAACSPQQRTCRSHPRMRPAAAAKTRRAAAPAAGNARTAGSPPPEWSAAAGGAARFLPGATALVPGRVPPPRPPGTTGTAETQSVAGGSDSRTAPGRGGWAGGGRRLPGGRPAGARPAAAASAVVSAAAGACVGCGVQLGCRPRAAPRPAAPLCPEAADPAAAAGPPAISGNKLSSNRM